MQKKDMNETIREQIMDARQCMGCIHEGLIVTSTDGTIVETSPAAERILEAPSLSLKGRQVRDLCSMRDIYDDLIRQTDSAGRSLNKSLMVLAGESKRKIVNMSVQRVGEGEACPIRSCVSGLRRSSDDGRAAGSDRNGLRRSGDLPPRSRMRSEIR